VKRGFAYLLVATILALVAVLVFVPRENAVENSAVDTLLLPGLADRINDVDRVEILTAGDTVVATLSRTAADWQLEQMDGYHADWPKLQELLAGLAQAKVVEVKTDKPQYYAQLGVEDVSTQDAESVLVHRAGRVSMYVCRIRRRVRCLTGHSTSQPNNWIGLTKESLISMHRKLPKSRSFILKVKGCS